MKHTECEDCKSREGDCGHHFKMDGKTNYDIASLSACDQYGNCEFFKPKAKPKGDLISREALKKELNSRVFQDDYATTLLLSSFNNMIDNAPTISDRYAEGYAQGYIDGSTGADWRFEE